MLIKDILFGENNNLMLSREMSLGIVQSKNKALYEDPGSVISPKIYVSVFRIEADRTKAKRHSARKE